MDAITNLLTWAESQGITINNKDAVVLDIPIPNLKSISTLPKSLVRLFPSDTAVHALLAADIALDTSPSFLTWSAVFPSPNSLLSCPLTWPSSLTSHLPSAASALLASQSAKFESHWALVSASLPSLTYDSYRYAWLLVNSRTFYHTTPRTLKRPAEDHMILQPVADLLNHAAHGCHVAFDTSSFTIRADRTYSPGEEIHICYGRHSNDFLLVEYGFIMSENEYDEIRLDDVIIPKLGPAERELLKERGFLGNYVLDSEEVCHRTQVALRTRVVNARRWAQFVDGFQDGDAEQGEVDALLRSMLVEYESDIEERIATVEKLEVVEAFQRDMLVTRWRQIQDMVRTAIEKLTT
ncbi:Ribosomal lysine N-methyltransferase set11 [Colletotrichum sidae]|uniref:Ribosomal lysine N-methyltransferase set11 n=1 Tax=Colletotrichum sidae TaxID=1347389 RepID=A0A4R8T4A2_9PEZI|nr:Ribosomal lysine N-methyltransferase set11 [Colletotrichum sidae]